MAVQKIISLHNTHTELANLVSAIVPACSGEPGAEPLDLSDCNYIGLDAAAIIAAMVCNSRHLGHSVRINLPSRMAPSQVGHLAMLGFNHFVDGSPLPELDQSQNPSVPLRVFTEANYSDANAVIDLAHRHARLNNELEESLRICVNEITQNVQDHSKSPFGAVLGAWFEPSLPNILQVAVVDCGIGIAASLRTRYPELAATKNALNRVIAGGVSAKSRKNNMGCGLSNVGAIVINQLRGQLIIMSGDGIAAGNRLSQQFGWEIYADLKIPFPGTGVFFAAQFK